jgi:hypothetical protein
MAHGRFRNNPGDDFDVLYKPCAILFAVDVQRIWAGGNAQPSLEECQAFVQELQEMTAVQIVQPRHRINMVYARLVRT